MISYAIKRICGVIPVAVGVVLMVGMLIHIVPGDPVDQLLGDYATLEEKLTLREQLGLNQPIHLQLSQYLLNVSRGNLGKSLIYHKPVSTMIAERAAATAELALVSILVALLLSIPLGIISALRKDQWPDYLSMGFALSGVAIPNFWLGPMLVLFFSVYLGWLPVSERQGALSYVLPALTMGTALAAALSRVTRNAMIEILHKDFIRTAKSKGLSNFQVVTKHAFRNACLPLVTVLGLQFGALLTGAVITEKVFDWPGIGLLVLDALHNRDYPLVQGCVMIFAFSYLCINLLTDLAYAIIDPRISLQTPSQE